MTRPVQNANLDSLPNRHPCGFHPIYKNENPPLERVPLPLGEGGAKRRVRVRMPKLFVVRPHPALRATFSRREKDPPRRSFTILDSSGL